MDHYYTPLFPLSFSRELKASPEQSLLYAIIYQAFEEGKSAKVHIRNAARRWLTHPAEIDFRRYCELLNWDPDCMQQAFKSYFKAFDGGAIQQKCKNIRRAIS